MKIEKDNLLESILKSISRIDYIHAEDIPNIDLYMDQVTTFMDEHLSSSKRFEADKILTKTMINNYSKNNLLPPSHKKKYSKEHMILLIFIYYFKNFLSINDIQGILEPITKKFFQSEDGRDLTDVYRDIFQIQLDSIDEEARDMIRKLRKANKAFADIEDPEERKLLSHFAYICSLSFDIWVKKTIIESILDKNILDNEN